MRQVQGGGEKQVNWPEEREKKERNRVRGGGGTLALFLTLASLEKVRPEKKLARTSGELGGAFSCFQREPVASQLGSTLRTVRKILSGREALVVGSDGPRSAGSRRCLFLRKRSILPDAVRKQLVNNRRLCGTS